MWVTLGPCREKKLQQAMGCLENAFNQCVMETSRAKSSTRRDFILTVDAGKWKKGVELLCTNIDCEFAAYFFLT